MDSPFSTASGADIYGDLPDFVLEDMEVDKLGVLTATVRVPRAYPLNPLWLVPWQAPAIFGTVPCSKIRGGFTEREGFCNLIYHYEGVLDSGNFTFPEDQATCEVDCQTMASAIQLHLRFLGLCKKFAGKFNPSDKDDFWYFAKNLPKGLQGSADPDDNTGQKNPLYGVEQYEVPKIVFRRTYLTATLPDNLLDGVGFIDNTIYTLGGTGP
jgi:hypothetical protein